MAAKSVCGRCYAPGRCCHGFQLDRGAYGEGLSGDEVASNLAQSGLPFRPLHRYPDGRWVFRCPRLSPEGRCADYPNRPSICRDYEPLTDGLCVHHGGAEAGDPTASVGEWG